MFRCPGSMHAVSRAHDVELGPPVEFACAKCGRVLTWPVRRLPEVPARKRDGLRSARPTVPAGVFAVDPEPAIRGPDGAPAAPIGCPILNPADLLEPTAHPDEGRRNGCCGLDGLDGPNLVCPGCGADVATLINDCWTSDEVRLEPCTVKMRRAALQ